MVDLVQRLERLRLTLIALELIEVAQQSVQKFLIASPQVHEHVADRPTSDRLLAGQLELAVFQNAAGLQTIGDNLYLETFASGPANIGNPGDPGIGAGTIRSGFLEGSNVEAVTQLVDLIRTQRAFEMNSQTFDAADQTLQTIVNLGR